MIGLPLQGMDTFPVHRLKSISRIMTTERAPRTRNAAGEMRERNRESETCTTVTYTIPNAGIEMMTPAATTPPSISIECFRSLLAPLPARNERKPG